MSMWRVYNEHPDKLTHKEKFRDELIEIKAGEFKLMDYEDAVLFKGQYFPMKMDATGVQDRTSYKVIRIAPDAEAVEAKKQVERVYVCHMDGKEFPSKEALEAYEKENYAHLVIKDESLDAELDRTQKKQTVKLKEKSL